MKDLFSQQNVSGEFEKVKGFECLISAQHFCCNLSQQIPRSCKSRTQARRGRRSRPVIIDEDTLALTNTSSRLSKNTGAQVKASSLPVNLGLKL
jgi:hypothetical protein